MKQYRFWAIAFSLVKLRLFAGAVGIIAILIAINVNSIREILYLCIVLAIGSMTFIFLFMRRFSISLHEDSINIKMNTTKEIVYPIEKLKFVRAVNINLPQSQGEINMVFDNRTLTFNILEHRFINYQTTSKQFSLINNMINMYGLVDQGPDEKHLSKLHIYSNPYFQTPKE